MSAALTAQAQTVINVPAGGNIAAAAAAAYSAGGGTVNLAAGTYNVTQSIVLGSNVTINGAGPSTLLQLPGTPNGIAMFYSYGGSNMTIENLTMDGGIPKGAYLVTGTTANPYSNSGVNMYSTNNAEAAVTLRNLEIRNFGIGIFMGTVNGLTIDTVYVHDNNPGNFSHNAYLVACNNVNIVHSRFNAAHTGDGLHIDFGGISTTVTKSEFSSNNGYGILSQGNLNVTVQSTIMDFNSNDGIQVDASGLFLLTNRGSYNAGYGFDIPDTLDGNGHLNGFYGFGDGADIGYFYESSIANITGDLSYPWVSNVYEAELADGVLGVNDTADWTTAYSGFSGVGAVDFNANHLTNGLLSFSHVGVVSAGNYQLIFRYSSANGSTLQMPLTVNGVAQTPLSFPTTGSNSTWSTITVTVPLNAGNNVVQISPSGSAAPEIDYLQVNTPTPAAPAAPVNVTATAAGPYQVNLTWPAVPGASGYTIVQNGRVIANNIAATTYSDTRILFGNSTLSYNIIAYNQGGGSPESPTVTVTTPIDAPAGLQVALPGGNTAGAALNWMSANGASYYNVKRSTVSGSSYVNVAKVTNTTNLTSLNFEQTYTDSSALPNTPYYYVVSAVDGSGNESVNSYEVAIVTAPASYTLSASPSAVSLAPGVSAATSIAVSGTGGFTAPVTFTAQGLPSGVTAQFSAYSNYASTLTLTEGTAANGTYNVIVTGTSGSISQSATVTVTIVSQLITFNPIPPQAVNTSLTLSATASSGLPVSFSVVPNGNCNVSGNVVTFVNTGNCGVLANQAGNSTYGPAPQVGQIVVVNGQASGQTITFAAIGTQTAGTIVALNATATSALPVTFASSTTGVCTVSGSKASLITAGMCTITASQAGDGSYTAATPVSQTFTVNGMAQTITFSAIPAQTAGTSLALTASASSNLAVTYTSSPASVCTVSGATASFVTGGTCTIVAAQAGNGIYAAAVAVSQSFTVNPPISVTIAPLTLAANNGTSEGASISGAVSAPGSLGLGGTACVNVVGCTYNLGGSNGTIGFEFLNVSANGALFVAVATASAQPGTYAIPITIGSTQVGTFNLTISPTSQTITFGTIPAQTAGSTLALSATASSNLAVTYTSSTTGVCTVNASTASFVTAGTCTITASQAGNSTYAAAASVSQSFTVNGEKQTITFGTIPAQTAGSTLALSATASSNLAVTYTSSTTGVCTVNGSTASFITAGTCTITASQAGNSTYAAAASVSQSFTVNGEKQTITFGTIPTQTAGSTLALSATASSNLAVTYTSSTTGVCTVNGSTASFITAGTCTITASQAGNSTYAAAASLAQSFSVNLAAQTITFNSIGAQTVGGTLTVSATASSGLPVSFSVVPNGNCSISGNTVTFLNAGNCGVVANQAGNGIYAAAPAVGQIIQVNNPFPQTITFAAVASQVVGTPLTLGATSNSGLAVTYASSTTAVCTVNGAMATFLKAGTCTITASQPGNVTYLPAPPVSQSFTVNPSVTIPSVTFTRGSGTTAPVTVTGAAAAQNLGLGANNPCVNAPGCTYSLGGSSGSIGFEFINDTAGGATLIVASSGAPAAGTYTIPVTIGSAQVGSFTLTLQ